MTDVKRGFPDLPCPSCYEIDSLQIGVSDASIFCMECERTWTPGDLENLARRYLALARFAASMPFVDRVPVPEPEMLAQEKK